MDKNKLDIANDLSTLIDQTEKAVVSLRKWIRESTNDSIGGAYGRDKNYNLSISAHKDGSGNAIDLARYLGNTKLLSVILTELEEQLSKYKKDWEDL